MTYARQTSEATLQVHVDSDWAGDLLGRKSTTGVIVRRGKHLLRHMSCLQTLDAPSGGEAEYYALIRGACTSLGIQSHYQDWMIDVPIQVYSECGCEKCCKTKRNWRTTETFADTSLVVAEPNSSWSLKMGMCSQVSRTQRMCSRNHCQVARFANGQNMLVKDGCIEAFARLNTS